MEIWNKIDSFTIYNTKDNTEWAQSTNYYYYNIVVDVV